MLKLERAGVVRRLSSEDVANTATWSPTFRIVKPDGGSQLIADLRAVNRCAKIPKFKADTFANVLAVAPNIAFAAKIDAKDYFWNLRQHESAARWMRYWDGQDGWEAVGLPFGWGGSPYWMERLARPVKQHLRKRGISLVWYVDDILLGATTRTDLIQVLTETIALLTRLGILLNEKKSVLVPDPIITFLGLQVNLATQAVSLPEEKRTALANTMKDTAKRRRISARKVQIIAGKLGHAAAGHSALHGWAKFLARTGAKMAPGRKRRNNNLPTPTRVKTIALHLARELLQPAPRPIVDRSAAVDTVIFTDASQTAWGAIVYTQKAPMGPHSENAEQRTAPPSRDPLPKELEQRRKPPSLTIGPRSWANRESLDPPGRLEQRKEPPSTRPRLDREQPWKIPSTAATSAVCEASMQLEFTTNGVWTQRQQDLHITAKEGLAATFGIQTALQLQRSPKRLLLITDATAVKAALAKGSPSWKLNWTVQGAIKEVERRNLLHGVGQCRPSLGEAYGLGYQVDLEP
eukprot:TRINITY_DN15873_c0_g2_i4.p2 TRINITY_DN15873_c0_g2~~TRINITY_DN15873_c0_g2_i4.p2  ORF type:complete len:520 (-),score=35.09 TRINITY_DN15873_c0_g2_i4:14-1573(-)